MDSKGERESEYRITRKRGGYRPKGSTSRTKREIIEIFEKRGLKIKEGQDINNQRKITAYTSEGYIVEAWARRVEVDILPYVFGAHNPHTIYNIKEIWLPNNAPDYELLDDIYVNSKTKMKWRKINSNLPPFEMHWNNFRRLRRHPLVGEEVGRTKRRATGEDILKLVEYKIKENESFSGWSLAIESDYEYIDGEDILIFRDSVGYLGCQTVQAIRNGYSIQRYTKIYPTTSTYNMYLWDKVENETERLKEGQEYKGAEKYIFVCEEHGDFEKWLSDARNGVICAQCELELRKGVGHPLYDPSISDDVRQKKRKYNEYYEWRRVIYERDNYTCQVCDSKKDICAHHIDGYNWCIKKRTDVNNGIVLCRECHAIGEYAFHRLYGNGFNTREQFEAWLTKYQDAIREGRAMD